jgi:glycosyltransferase involved in cell wall biosynthesis
MDSGVMASVVVITFNHAPFIEQSLQSILAQDVDFKFEIIVRDDCSTDGTSEIVAAYAKAHTNIVHIRYGENLFGTRRGFQSVEEIFTQRAKGKYIFELEGDDFWSDPLKMRRQVAFMESNPACALSFHDWIHVDETGAPLTMRMPESAKQHISQSGLLAFEYAWILWGTCCTRRTDCSWPNEVSLSISTDMFIPYMAGKLGYAEYLSDIAPLCYRQTRNGVWSGIDASERAKNKLITSLAIVGLLARDRNVSALVRQFNLRLLPALATVAGRQ